MVTGRVYNYVHCISTPGFFFKLLGQLIGPVLENKKARETKRSLFKA